MNDRSAIVVKDLTVSYDSGDPVLRGIDFKIPEGVVVAIVGPNGSGKTTLLKALLGTLPYSGDIKVIGKNPRDVKGSVGYVPQRFSLESGFPITVNEFLKYSFPNVSSDVIERRLEHFGMQDMGNSLVGNLSGGQMQRMLLVRAMLENPSILYLDEPSSGIDIGGEETFYDLISHVHKQHASTIVMVSHEIDVVYRYADMVLCVNKDLLCHGAPRDVLTAEVLEELYGAKAGIYAHKEK